MKKKDKGSSVVEDVLSTILTILAITVVCFMITFVVIEISVKEDAKEIARAYLLEMETVGYLTPQMQQNLLDELADVGLENIDLTGTTMVDVGYGERINIVIKAEIVSQTFNTSSGELMSFFVENVNRSIAITRRSTAKR